MSASGAATRTLLCLLAFSAALPGQQADRESARPAAIPTAEKNKLAALLPAPPEFFGKPGPPARFYSTDLYRYLDGGADAYLDYGLVALIHREFKSGNVDLTVDIYDMGDPLQAFGIYSAERSPDYLFIPIGAEGHVDMGSLGFLQANYYVKLQAFGDNDNTPPALEAAARGIMARIGPRGTAPQPVSWFPAAGQVAASQKYVVKAPLGRDYLAPATTALYRFDTHDTTVLASRAPTAEEATARLGRLKEDFARPGAVAAAPGFPGQVWRTAGAPDGETVFFARGCYVVVVLAPPADADAFLKELYASVKD
ncbi:MAG TPA: DUF6599 family protein [Bryobacteraceae bacterium]|nr:DUF6599 family protein [Bryobacteraceae bacterium]